ncbi:activating transcription factor-2 [Anaeramoeba flamelloides]|uniref:Activating transcription factor-2 n=1 Tax=Anaeramoeba flamelloides TaxID=1746091 RepID=A0AAV7ZVI4_9EUKA|nr:activating transcription factor-2 [Anaeramoeba flamelloides]
MNNSLQDYFSFDQWEKKTWERTNDNDFNELFLDSSLELITSIDDVVSEQNLFSEFSKPQLQNYFVETNSEPKQEPIFQKKIKPIPKNTITKMPEFDFDLIQKLKELQNVVTKETTNQTKDFHNPIQTKTATKKNPQSSTSTVNTKTITTKKNPLTSTSIINTNTSTSTKANTNIKASTNDRNTSPTISITSTTTKKPKTNEKHSSLRVQPSTNTIRKRTRSRRNKYLQQFDSKSQEPVYYVDGTNLLAKMTQEQLNKLSTKQRSLRKIYKNRLAAKRSADRIKNKINFLGKKTVNLQSKNKNLKTQIAQVKNERDQLLERTNDLEKELKELREKEKPKLETSKLFGSIRNAIERLSTIPSNKNENEDEMILPSTINFMDQKWGTIKKKLVQNTNNRTGFAMMIVILAITFFFGNEMLFGSSTSFSIPFFSDDADYTRNLKSLEYLKKTAMENWGDSSNIVLIEEVKQSITNSETDTDTDTDTQLEPENGTVMDMDTGIDTNMDKHTATNKNKNNVDDVNTKINLNLKQPQKLENHLYDQDLKNPYQKTEENGN